MGRILSDTYPESSILFCEDVTSELLEKQYANRDIYICDFCSGSVKARGAFYTKYQIGYIIWDLKDPGKILQDRSRLYTSVALLQSDNTLYHILNGTDVKVCTIDLARLIWNSEKQCYEYSGDLAEDVESVFTMSWFYKNPYILYGDKMIPIIALKYLQIHRPERMTARFDIAYNIIPEFEKCGVRFLVFNSPNNEKHEIAERLPESYLSSEDGDVFRFDNDRYAELVGDKQLAEELINFAMRNVMKDGFLQGADFSGKYVNYKQNERYTVGNPEEFQHTVYLFGPCIIRGLFVKDEDTIGSVLREKVAENYCIKNYGHSWETIHYLMRTCRYRPGDVVILFTFDKDVFVNNGINVHSVIEAYCKIPDIQNHVWDTLMHGDALVVRYMTDEIYRVCVEEQVFADEYTEEQLQEQNSEELYFGTQKKTIDVPEQLKQWLSEVKKYKVSDGNKAGAIVMNCNPFTRGHRYLAEEASKKVDVLYIFVLEEDKSFFTFRDRFEMVKMGVADMKNVIVVPSGRYIISTETLPGYFEKEENPYVELDATEDMELFAGVIAKEFDISDRIIS